MSDQQVVPSEKDWAALLRITNLVYGLQGVGLLLGWFPAVVGVILSYVKLEDVQGSWLESHFRWQIRTFWWGLVWGILGILTFVFVIGWFILIADGIWVLYRVIKGWLNLNDKKTVSGTPAGN